MSPYDQKAPLKANRILSRLSHEAIDALEPKYLHGRPGAIVLPADDPIHDLYFPVTALVSLICTMQDGATGEVGVVGPEGAVGFVTLMGAKTSPYDKMIQVGGDMIRIHIDTAKREFVKGGEFQREMLSFAQKFAHQVAQMTQCHRLHNIEQRLCRWLLMCHDRIHGDVIHLTQEFIAMMLGASRVRITQAAQRIQAGGSIAYVRGRINILDRQALEARSCECYQIIRKVYDAT